MLDQAGIQTLFDDVHRLWVEPELVRRREKSSITDNFRIRGCLIRLPVGSDPIVEFNDEIVWEVKVTTAKGIEFKRGDPVYLSQVDHIEGVEPPKVDGVIVPFFFLFWSGKVWRIIFDASLETNEDWQTTHGASIVEHLNHILAERSIHTFDVVHTDMEPIALWPAPALIPYPLSALCELCRDGKIDEARVCLVEHCSCDFLANFVATWNRVPAFRDRSQLFADALHAHATEKYTLSISALVPQIEGTITDWLYSKLPSTEIPWRHESKAKKFRDLVTLGARRTYTDQRIAECVAEFIVNGPVLESFSEWLAPISSSFPNRHVVGHGKYDMSLYTQENSIKMFLMFDTLYSIMFANESK